MSMPWDNRYRPLREGETILAGDECLTDSHLGWQPAKHDIGGKAPDPAYTSHRMYRRLRTTSETCEQSSDAGCGQAIIEPWREGT
jgi:hypothetical protein